VENGGDVVDQVNVTMSALPAGFTIKLWQTPDTLWDTTSPFAFGNIPIGGAKEFVLEIIAPAPRS
jgi:hypothetical protein